MEHSYEQIFQTLMNYQKHLQHHFGIVLKLDLLKIVAEYAAFVPMKSGWLDQRGKKKNNSLVKEMGRPIDDRIGRI